MMSLPVWLPGRMFLPGESLSRRSLSRGSLSRGGGICLGVVSVGRPLPRIRKVVGTHPTECILICTLLIDEV